MGLSAFDAATQDRIRAVGGRLAQLQPHWPAAIQLGLAADASIYDAHPFLFAPAFPAARAPEMESLALAGRLVASSLFLQDAVVDGQRSTTMGVDSLRVLAMQWEAYGQLRRLFAADSPFWPRFERYLTDYAAACIEEHSFARGELPWSAYTEEVARRIAAGKAGVARASVAGLAALAGDDGPVAVLCDSIDRYNVGFQMFDDLRDWRSDLRAAQPSLLLVKALGERPAEVPSDLDALARAIYYGEHAEDALRLATRELDTAARQAHDTGATPWAAVCLGLRDRCERLQGELNAVMGANVRRARELPPVHVEFPSAQSVWEDLAQHAARYLILEWRRGFGEARHVMVFSHDQGFRSAEHQAGDVFQRSVIAEALCDLRSLVGSGVEPLVEGEIAHLFAVRRRDGTGWSYFPELDELPSDADDLAAVTQLLVGAGRPDLVRLHVEPVVDLLLERGAHDDGSFETWIIPAPSASERAERQTRFAAEVWGTGADVDVVANLAYALLRYDPSRYGRLAARAAAYVSARQSGDGSWASTWYHGPYYGTYVCGRLLAAVGSAPDALRRAQEFVRASQRADGGWGHASSDALSTALALLALAQDPERAGRERTRSAAELLRALRSDGRGWPKEELIRMPLGRASGRISDVLSYGSRTMTTAFVGKAAAAWARLDAG